jgi:hypothetical protein
MCFDICTINIRVSIRGRGLHLVFVFPPVFRWAANDRSAVPRTNLWWSDLISIHNESQWITMNHYESLWIQRLVPVISRDLSFDSEQFSERFNCVQPVFSAMCMWICQCICVQTQVRRSCGQRSLQTENADFDLGKFARRHPQCSNAGSTTTLHNYTALPLDHVVNHVVSWKMVRECQRCWKSLKKYIVDINGYIAMVMVNQC